MARPRLEAHFVVIAASAKKYATTTNILGVDYVHPVPADAEFPRRIGRLDVFVRFFCGACVPETLALEVWRLNPDGTDRERVHTRFQEVPLRDDLPVQDFTFRLSNIDVPAEGVYAVRVCRLSRTRTRGLHWRALRSDFFEIRRQ